MNNSSQQASLKISQDVVETIARVAALEIDGVADVVQPQTTYQGFLSGSWMRKPIDIKIAGGVAEISLCLVLDFGASIGHVCEAVQTAVKENVQTMTGIMVSKVNIAVENINLPANRKNADQELEINE